MESPPLQDFYIPTDEEQEEEQTQSIDHYRTELNNMLATILETQRDMEFTTKTQTEQIQLPQTLQQDQLIFNQYKLTHPEIVQKILKKFHQFNLNFSQLLKFIQIELKFINLKNQQRRCKQTKITEDNHPKQLENNHLKQPETHHPKQLEKVERKNLVQVHRMYLKKKSYQVNPRIFLHQKNLH